MKPKVSFMLVGAFVLIMGAVLMATVVWLSAAGQNRTYKPYVAYMTESVSGLGINARVSYNGVEIGVVRAIDLDRQDPTRVRVLLDIEHDAPIKVDTVAQLASSGITGVAHVELSGGTPASEMLRVQQGQEYPVIETRPSMFVRLDSSITTLVEKLGGAADSLTQVADRVELLLDEENREAISGILANVETFSVQMNTIAADVSRVTSQVAATSAELPGLVEEASDTIAAFESAALLLGQAGTDVSGTSASLQGAVEGIAGSVETILSDLTPLSRGGPARLVQLVDELQLLASSLRSLAQDVDRNPEMLLFGRRDVVRGPGE